MLLKLNNQVFCKIELVINSLTNVDKKTSFRTKVKKSLLKKVLFEKMLFKAKKLLLNISVNKIIYC